MGGLLDDRRHTSNAREYLAATGYRGSGLYRELPAVSDGNVITAAGTAPVDFAYEIFKQLDLYPPRRSRGLVRPLQDRRPVVLCRHRRFRRMT